MNPSHIRVVAYTCVLAVGVMIGTPAIAFAEPSIDGSVTASGETTSGSPELTSSTTGSDATAASLEPTAAESAEDSAAAAERNAVEGVESTVGSGREPGDPPLAEEGGSTETSTTEQPSATTSATDEESVTADADTGSANSDSDSNTATSESNESEGSGAAPAVQTQSAGSTAAPPDDTPSLPATETVPAAAYAMAVPYLALLGVQAVAAPIAHVLAAVTYLLAEVVVVPLLHLQRDLAMLFSIAGVEPVVDSLARIGVALSPSVQDALASKFGEPVPGASPLDAASIAASAPEAVFPAAETPPPAVAPHEPGESVLSRVSSFIGDITRELLESPTLMALAIAALPGLGGLLVLTAGGVRLGYRQAKARVAIQMHGIARFVAVEPTVSARCGALVLLRPRTWSAREPDVTAMLDEAA